MVRGATKADAVRYATDVDAEEEMLMAETAEAVRTLRARLSAAQDRAAAADIRRQQIVADQTQTMRSQVEDVHKLEDTISQLKLRAREYNRALNEAATLVDEMDGRILAFERQIAAMHGAVAAASTAASGTARRRAEITETSLARDLDLIRRHDPQADVLRLKHQFDRILAA